MPKAVFTTKVSPTYDDLPEVRYHFPKTYLAQASRAVGDWIVYYEPRRASADESSRGGRQSYFAAARVIGVEPDNDVADHFYAIVSDFLEFDRPVPFRIGRQYFENALMRPDGQTSKGMFGRSVRPLTDSEFDSILRMGFSNTQLMPALTASPPSDIKFVERRRIEVTLSRPFREEAFRRKVCAAYANKCAISGLSLTDGDGRPEVQAAHIQPVAQKGPDSVRNGLALSGTLHWLFDRGLVTADENLRIVCADKLPRNVAQLVRPGEILHLPDDPTLKPHSAFLGFHRSNVFKR